MFTGLSLFCKEGEYVHSPIVVKVVKTKAWETRWAKW